MKKLGFAAFTGILFILAGAGAFAQAGAVAPGRAPFNSGGPYPVQFLSNVNGARVYVDGNYMGTTDITRPVQAGNHGIRISADGYADWNRTIFVNGEMKVRAQLVPTGSNQQPPARSYTLTITANINGAAVEVDGAQLRGGTPVRVTLAPGNHRIRVSANGYGEWTRTIDLNRNESLQAYLQPRSYTLRVLSNVAGARVIVSNAQNGNAPYQTQVPGGYYTITVTAPGYLAFTTTVTMDSDQTIRAVLRGGWATVELVLPERYRNPFVNNPFNQIEWYVDGKRQHGKNDRSIEVSPGTHTIRIVSGGLSIEERYVLQAGETYRLSPRIELDVRQ